MDLNGISLLHSLSFTLTFSFTCHIIERFKLISYLVLYLLRWRFLPLTCWARSTLFSFNFPVQYVKDFTPYHHVVFKPPGGISFSPYSLYPYSHSLYKTFCSSGCSYTTPSLYLYRSHPLSPYFYWTSKTATPLEN